MAPGAHRAPRRPAIWGLVLGLTPGLASADPPDPEPVTVAVEAEPPGEDSPDDAGEAPGLTDVDDKADAAEPPPSVAPSTVRLELISTAVSIEVIAVPLGDDGRAQGPAVELGAPPIITTLAAGRWRLETRGPGYQPFSRELTLEPGRDVQLQIDPTLIPGARLELHAANEASEGATVELDGVELCRLPCSETIEPGRHTIEITKRRHKPLHSEFEAVQADEIVFDVVLERATSRAPALVTGTIALASLTTAVVFTVRSAQARRSLMADLDAGVQYDQDDRRIDNGRRDAIIASAMYGVTGAIGALTLYYLLRQAGPSSQAQKRRRSLAGALQSWQLGPSFGPRGGALVLRVGF